MLKSSNSCFRVNDIFKKQREINLVTLSEGDLAASTVRNSNSSIAIINESLDINNNNNHNFENKNLENDNMNITYTGSSDFNYVEYVNLSDFSHAISEEKQFV